MTFSSTWNRIVAGEDKEQVKATVLRHREVLDPLRVFLSKELDALIRKEEAVANYSAAGFSAQQADYIGQRRQLRSIVELLTFDQEDTE